MTSNRNVELFAIGNELLVGQVQDTNSHWIIRNITSTGAKVVRAAMLRDEIKTIGDEIKAAVRRKPRLILTTGGLGPTDDDLTVRAISQAFNLPLSEDPIALEMVRARYAYIASIRENYSAELNEARRKMALMPAGAIPLKNPNGAAPAVALALGETVLVLLPGVPSEMKEIFASSLQPILERTIGAGGYVERNMVLDRGDESRIADVLQTVQARHSAVYIKSRGQILAQYGQRLTVVLSCGGNDLSAARAQVHETEVELLDGLHDLGYAILDVLDS